MKLFLPFVLAVTAWAQNTIGLPCLGKIVERAGTIRELCGVAGVFLLSDKPGLQAVSAGFSRSGSWIKTEDHILLSDGATRLEFPAPTGPAMFAFRPGGRPAYAWLKDSGELWEWDGAAIVKHSFPVEGEVLSIAVSKDDGWLIAVRLPGVGIALVTEHSQTLLDTKVKTAIPISEDRLVTYSEGALHLGSGASFPLDGPPRIVEWINAEWLHIDGTALRITGGQEALFVLPEAN